MPSSTQARDAPLKAQTKRLLTRDWVDSNSRNSEHLRPSSSWNPPKASNFFLIGAGETNNYHRGDCKSAGVKADAIEHVFHESSPRSQDQGCTNELSPEETEGSTVNDIKAPGEKNKWTERTWKGIDSEEGHEEITTRLKESQSHRTIAEKLDGSDSGDVEDIYAPGSIGDLEEADEELGFADDLFQTCLYIFRELWVELSEMSPSPKCLRDGLLVEGLGKFYLWGESFQDGSLDTALAQSDELREDVLKLICQIGSILTRRLCPMVVAPSRRTRLDGALQHLTLLSEKVNAIISGTTSEANSDSEDIDEERAAPGGRHNNEGTTGRDIRLLTGCLMELVPTLEQSLPRVGELARSALLAPPPLFQVSWPAVTYVRNVSDKFPRADVRLTERLGEANWQRHVKVRNMIDQIANDEPVESKGFVVAPFSEFRDSALGSSIPNQTHYAASTAPHTSFVSSLADGEERSIRVPPTPAEVSAGKPFQCHICGQTLYRIRNRVDWKIHVFADLQPYICTFSTCNDALVKFSTRKMWADHEFDEHRVTRSLVCPDCSAELSSPDAWDEHLRQEHNITFEGSQHALALDSARRMISKPIDEQQCPMCKVIPGSTQRAFSTHVGRHMEQIALAVLPRETDDDLEGSSVASDLPIHDQRERPSLGPDIGLSPDVQSEFHKGSSDLEMSRAPTVTSVNLLTGLPKGASISSLDASRDAKPEPDWLYGNDLLAAAEHGDESMVQALLETVADADVRGCEYWSALQTASVQGHEAVVQTLLQVGADANAQGGIYENALQAASAGGHKRVLQMLLQAGADANAQDDTYGSVLQAASAGGHGNVVQTLLQAGADANAQGGAFGNALQAASAGGHGKVVQMLLQAGADANAQGGTYGNALVAASVRAYKAVVQLLLQAGADADIQGGAYGNALQAASAAGHGKVVQILLQAGADANTQGGTYGNALRGASAGGHGEVVKMLLQAGAVAADVEGSGYGSALGAASARGHETLVQLLLESRAAGIRDSADGNV